MRILVIGDLHGQEPRVHFPDADVIVAPGDFCSDAVRQYAFQAMMENASRPDRSPDRTIAWYDLLDRAEAELLVRRSLEAGRSVLEALDATSLPVIVIPGNGDWASQPDSEWDLLRADHYGELISGLRHVVDIDHRSLRMGEITFVGYGSSAGPEVPQDVEERSRYSRETLCRLEARFAAIFEHLSSQFPNEGGCSVLLSHNMPFGVPLDLITHPSSPRFGKHFGSVVTRKLVEVCRPSICIGGHMHEHFGLCFLEGIPIVNGGYGNAVNVLIDIDEGAVRSIRFHGPDPIIHPIDTPCDGPSPL
ncbi:MAG: metallophosphoesterase family protein [Desulfobacterales bacterium]